MKWTLIIVILAGLAGVGIMRVAMAGDAPATGPATQPVAINKMCAVEKDNPVDPRAPTFTYEGQVIGFCCEDCINTFKKDPKKYMVGLK